MIRPQLANAAVALIRRLRGLEREGIKLTSELAAEEAALIARIHFIDGEDAIRLGLVALAFTEPLTPE